MTSAAWGGEHGARRPQILASPTHVHESRAARAGDHRPTADPGAPRGHSARCSKTAPSELDRTRSDRKSRPTVPWFPKTRPKYRLRPLWRARQRLRRPPGATGPASGQPVGLDDNELPVRDVLAAPPPRRAINDRNEVQPLTTSSPPADALWARLRVFWAGHPPACRKPARWYDFGHGWQ